MALDKSIVQKSYTTIMQHFIDHGHAPHYTGLAGMLGISIEEARQYQAEAARLGVGCWLAEGTDLIASFAPFSNIPTNYRITIDGERKWYGQWGLESLAVRWLFPGQEIVVETNCLHSGDVLTIRMRDEEILEISPESIVGHMNVPFAKIRTGEVSSGFA